MMIMYFMAAGYFLLLGLFAYYGFLNVKQTKTLLEWNDKTDGYIKAIRDRNLELEKKVKELEKVAYGKPETEQPTSRD